MTQRKLLEMLAKRVRNRVLRGGAWYNTDRNCRSAYRRNNGPDDRHHYYHGFRVVCIRRNHDAKATT